MKNQSLLISFITILIIQFLFSQKGLSQTDSKLSSDPFKPSVTAAVDIFPLDVNVNLCVNINPSISFGVFAEAGKNFTEYFIVAGDHFAKEITLFKYNGRDDYDGEFYAGLVNLGLFSRIALKDKHIFDIGFQNEFFIHYDKSDDDIGGGEFLGLFTTYHFPSKWKEKEGKFKKRPSFGMRFSVGQFIESESLNQFGVMSNLWVRIYMNTNKRYQ